MSDNSPWSGGEVTATVKFGKGYDDPWLVFRGDPDQISEQVIASFGLEETEGLTLAELIVNASKQAQAVRAASAGLGGSVISQGNGRRNAWAEAAGSTEPAQPERNPLYGKLEEVTDVAALKELYARNKAAFDGDAELLAAWKAKGKSLTEAAA